MATALVASGSGTGDGGTPFGGRAGLNVGGMLRTAIRQVHHVIGPVGFLCSMNMTRS